MKKKGISKAAFAATGWGLVGMGIWEGESSKASGSSSVSQWSSISSISNSSPLEIGSSWVVAA